MVVSTINLYSDTTFTMAEFGYFTGLFLGASFGRYIRKANRLRNVMGFSTGMGLIEGIEAIIGNDMSTLPQNICLVAGYACGIQVSDRFYNRIIKIGKSLRNTYDNLTSRL
ncbi:MAG: hypothetical protein QXH80_05025 [Candidatus Nanoarchaeia archaeon]